MHGETEKTIYELFKVSIWIKILGSAAEMLAGLLIAIIPSSLVFSIAAVLSQADAGNDADDFLAREFVTALHAFSISNDLLIGIYLFVRGLVQLVLGFALLRNKLWAYPLLIVVLTILVVTQLYAIYFSHSLATILITVVDIVTIYLVWHEYRIASKEVSIRKPMV